MHSLWLHPLARFSADVSTKYGRGPKNVCYVPLESKIYQTARPLLRARLNILRQRRTWGTIPREGTNFPHWLHW